MIKKMYICSLALLLCIGCTAKEQPSETSDVDLSDKEPVSQEPAESDEITDEGDSEQAEEITVSLDPVILPDVQEFRTFDSYETLSVDSLLENRIIRQYPADYEIFPNRLCNDTLFGYTTGDDLSVFSLSARDGQFVRLIPMERENTMQNAPVRFVSDDLILYEKTDQLNRTAMYSVFDRNTGETRDILYLEDIPGLHYTYTAPAENGFLLNCLRIEGHNEYNYVLVYYDHRTGELRDVESSHCGYPVTIGRHCYYLLIDRAANTTKLIHCDLDTLEKTVLFETEGAGYYMNSLCSNGTDSLIFSIFDQNVKHVYEVSCSDNHCKYLFDAGWYESMQMGSHYLSWYGDNLLPDRIQPQYHLFDTENMIYYSNPYSMILLNNDGMYLNKTKLPDAEIGKVNMFNPDIAEMAYIFW